MSMIERVKKPMRKAGGRLWNVSFLFLSLLVLFAFLPSSEAHAQAALAVPNVTVNEGAGNAIVGVRLNISVPGGFMVTARTVTLGSATATAGQDFMSTSSILVFSGNAGEIQNFTVPIVDDDIVEGSERFTVSLSNVTGTTVSVNRFNTGAVTITDNDARAAQLTVADVTVNEDVGNATVQVTLNTAVTGGFTVTAATANGTATAGDDYTATTS